MSIPISNGTGASSVATEVVSSLHYQRIKIVGGETGSTSVMGVNPDRSINVSVIGTLTVAAHSVAGTVGASVIGTVPIVQSGTVITSVSGIIQASVHGIVMPFAPTTSLVSGVTSIITSTARTSVLSTAPGGQRNYVTQILVTNGAANGTFVDIMDGPNVIYSGYAAASGGGYALSFPAPLRQPTLALSMDMQVTTQASIKAAISGFTAP